MFSPAGLLITGFIFLSGVGGLLLALPIANNQGGTPLIWLTSPQYPR